MFMAPATGLCGPIIFRLFEYSLLDIKQHSLISLHNTLPPIAPTARHNTSAYAEIQPEALLIATLNPTHSLVLQKHVDLGVGCFDTRHALFPCN